MSSLNKVTIIGSVGKEPEIRSTQNGKEIANFSVACNERWRDKNNGESKERTEWINICVFTEAVVNLIKSYVHKGSKIYIEGALATRKYTDKDGIERYVTEVVLQGFNSRIILLDGKNATTEVNISTPPTFKKKGYEVGYDDEDEILF